MGWMGDSGGREWRNMSGWDEAVIWLVMMYPGAHTYPGMWLMNTNDNQCWMYEYDIGAMMDSMGWAAWVIETAGFGRHNIWGERDQHCGRNRSIYAGVQIY
jgi:hypothetical protein